jgi:hypothetical protein
MLWEYRVSWLLDKIIKSSQNLNSVGENINHSQKTIQQKTFLRPTNYDASKMMSKLISHLGNICQIGSYSPRKMVLFWGLKRLETCEKTRISIQWTVSSCGVKLCTFLNLRLQNQNSKRKAFLNTFLAYEESLTKMPWETRDDEGNFLSMKNNLYAWNTVVDCPENSKEKSNIKCRS